MRGCGRYEVWPSPGWQGWNHTGPGWVAALGVLPPLPGDVSRQACYLKQRIRITGRATSCVPGARPGSAQLESHPDYLESGCRLCGFGVGVGGLGVGRKNICSLQCFEEDGIEGPADVSRLSLWL